MKKLSDVMKEFKTVNKHNCSKCGNPWWWDMVDHLKCTTCNHEYGKLNASHQGDEYSPESRKKDFK